MVASPLPHDPSRRRAPDERPRQILDAALEVFAEQGLAGARLDDIARRAGIAKGTIYLYFPNKEELFREVVRRTIGDRVKSASDAIANLPAEASPESRLRLFAKEWWAFLRTSEYQTVYRLVLGELHRFPELLAFYAEEAVVPARRLLSGLIASGTDAGTFRDVDAEVAARCMASMFTTHAIWVSQKEARRALGDRCDADAVFEQLYDFAIHALRPDVASAGAGASNA